MTPVPLFIGQKRRHPATGQTVTITHIHAEERTPRVSFSPIVGISYAYSWAVQTWELVK